MLKNMRGIVWVALIIFGAVLQPQNSDARLVGPHATKVCGDCHSAGFASMFNQAPTCITAACHINQLVEADASQLFNYSSAGGPVGTSHAWGVSYTESGAAAKGPSTTRQTRYGPGNLGCSSCHYPHYALNNITSQPLLKVDNSSDQLCLDCHRDRNVTSASPPPAGKQGSHPVGLTIPGTTAYNSPPLNPYSSISGSELKLVGPGSDTVSCSTCHGVHFADSNPYTAATMVGLSTVPGGQGVLLRRYNDSQLCKDCHRYQQHGPLATPAKWQDCRNCHDPHDPGANFKLVRFDSFSGPEGWVQVTFDSLTSNFAERIDGKQGICDACHSLETTGVFPGWSSGHLSKGISRSLAYQADCLNCHSHAEGDGTSVGSFAAGGAAACGTCHGYPPMANYSGPPSGYAGGYNGAGSFVNETTSPHRKHASSEGYGSRFAGSGSYGTACKACHGMPDESTHQTKVVYGDWAFKLYTWPGGSPTYAQSGGNKWKCINNYCHSDGAPNDVISYTTPTWSSLPGTLDCSGCHAAAPVSNKHTKHIGGGADYSFGCRNCHVNTVDDNSTISAAGVATYHVDRTKSVFFGATAVSGTYTAATKDCSNTYCHGNLADNQGNNATPTFGAAGTATCGSCHDLAPAGDIATHTKHVQTYDFGCAYCHNDLVTAAFDTKSTIDNQAMHVNNSEDVKFGNDLKGRTNAAGTYTKATGKCDTIYCHSAGTSTLAANFFVNESTIWNSATVTCASCHGNSVYSGMTSAMPNYPNGQDGKENSHVKHVVNNGIDCISCHEVTLATNVTIGNYTSHVNAKYNVDISATYGGSYDTGTQTCTGVSCHGAGAPVWGATLSCADCHNGAGDVDDFVFDNKTTATINQTQWDNVGHGRTSAFPSGNPAANLGCANCHDSGVSHGVAGNPFRLFSSNPDQLCNTCHGVGGAATKTGVFTHSSTTTDGRHDFKMKCVDCHDPHGDDNAFMMHSTLPQPNGQPNWEPSNQYGIPNGGVTWENIDFPNNGAAFLASTSVSAATVKVCNVCHSRTTDVGITDSKKRYRKDMSGGITEAHYVGNQCTTSCHKHTAGFEGVSCEGCHGMPPETGLMLQDLGAYDASPTGEGAHVKHGSIFISGPRCNVCHDKSIGGMDPSGATNTTIDINFKADNQLGSYTTGTYDATGAAHNPAYNGSVTTGGTFVCSNVKCHGSALTSGNGTDTTPVWNNLATGACGKCHGAKTAPSTAADGGTGYPGSGAHQKHAGWGAGEYDIMCQTCHDTTLTTATTFVESLHVNADTGSTGIGIEPAYNDTATAFNYVDGTNTCENADCHGENSVVWTAGAQTCDSCHNGASDADNFTYSNLSGVVAKINNTEYTNSGHGRTTAYPVSGNPGANKGCTDCHTATKDHSTGATYFRLLNTDDPNTLCLSCHGSGAELTGAFGTITGYQGHTYDNLSTAGYTNLTTWHFTPKCIDCHDPHGDGNIFMMHSKVSDEGSSTVAPLGVPTNFPNNSTVIFLSVTGVNSYDDGDGTANLCVVCHDRTSHNGNSGSHAGYAGLDCRGCHDHKLGFTPSGCDGCHGQAGVQIYPPDGPNLPLDWAEEAATPASVGSHEAHVTKLSYACAECHGDGNGQDQPHGTGKTNAYMKNLTSLHGANFTPNLAGTSSVVDDTCANVDCHSGRAYQRSWINNPTTCDACHGGRTSDGLNQISTGSHVKHTGNGATEYDFQCTLCHVDNTGNFDHYSVADVDLNFTGQGTGSSYTRGTGFATFTTGAEWGTCTSACHGDGLPSSSSGTPTWGGSSLTCENCHYATGNKALMSAPHPTHLNAGTYNFDCFNCHVQTTTDNTTINNYTAHVNGNRNVDFDTYLDNDSGSFNGTATKQCLNIYCHSNGTDTDGVGPFPMGNFTADWDGATQGCKYCHGDETLGGWTSAMPNYANGAPKANSHAKHVNGGYQCIDCHEVTLATNAAIGNYTAHINGNYNIDINASYGASAAYTPGTKVCSNVDCHGGNPVTWGDPNVNCFTCHNGTDDGAGTMKPYSTTGNGPNVVNFVQYTTVGHGLNTGSTYKYSALNGAGKWNSSGQGCYSGDPQTGCHSAAAGHITKNPADPFRLGAWADDIDGLCATCHNSAQASSHSAAVTGNPKGRTWPYVPKCVDCHDPHGDANIRMIRSSINTPSSGSDWTTGGGSNSKGVPTTNGTIKDVTFTNNSGFSKAGGFAGVDAAAADGICEVCHTNNAAIGTIINWYNAQGDDNNTNHVSNAGKACSNCHQHDGGFAASGGSCDSCHSWPPKIGDGSDYMSAEQEGKGRHSSHFVHLSSLSAAPFVNVSAATAAGYGQGINAEICGTCHSNDESADHQKGGRNINFGAPSNTLEYSFDGTAPFYNGSTSVSSATRMKNCSNVRCHFQNSPGWQDPSEPKI
ncbi:MAG: CxxxxCH/CxxCH domain-containing protein [bacterium]|nr:CxxxxCH/CxxCH domain-containing protein [bacterium]